VTILAEAYLGENLGAFMGGVAQGVRKVGGNPDTIMIELTAALAPYKAAY